MTVKELKQSLSDVPDDLEVIALDSNRAKEYKVIGSSITLDEYLERHTNEEPQFILGI